MSAPPQERIAIVGLGAVGGSMALALRDQAALVAWSHDPADRAAARAAGIPIGRDDGARPMEELASAAMIVLAVPLDEIGSLVREILPRLPDDALLLHTASLQRREALALSDEEFRRVIVTHPIAGSERSGFAAADVGRFRGATVRAEARATDADRQRVERLWRATGAARIVWGDATEHDALMSWISHLPQLASTALAMALADRGISPGDVGRGARDATRLASSDPTMWIPILRNAPSETHVALRRLTSVLSALGDALERQDAREIEASWQAARAWRTTVERSS